MKMPKISRMSGAGNTFFLWNAIENPIPVESRTAVVRLLCSGYTGFRTDGFVFLDSSSHGECDFVWDFYNSDGSSAEMCGNAARCVALYYFKKMNPQVHGVAFQTRAGLVRARWVDQEEIEVIMPPQSSGPEFIEILVGRKPYDFFYTNSGVPHLIVEGEPDEALAAQLRRSPEVGEAGTNVTFVNEVTPGELEAVTYERGVEGFTLACGTGAIAAAQFSKEKNPLLKNHLIEMPGGALRVHFDGPQQISLIGPAQFEFDLTFSEDE